jgi:Zn finger protein HypA/HybF involved in hydrogenase expression
MNKEKPAICENCHDLIAQYFYSDTALCEQCKIAYMQHLLEEQDIKFEQLKHQYDQMMLVHDFQVSAAGVYCEKCQKKLATIPKDKEIDLRHRAVGIGAEAIEKINKLFDLHHGD